MAGYQFAYLILAHHDEALLQRLLRRLHTLSPLAIVVLHLDRKSRLSRDRLGPMPWVHVLDNNLALEWGDWSMVEAELHGLRWIREHTEATHVVLISGQDYPVLPLGKWEAGIVDRDMDAVLVAEPVVGAPRWGRRRRHSDGTFVRYRYRWHRMRRTTAIDIWSQKRLPQVRKIMVRLLENLEPLVVYRYLPRGRGTLLGLRRRTPFNSSFLCYKGWQWMVLRNSAVDSLLDACSPTAGLAEYYKSSLIPDESLFHTILCNRSDLKIENAPFTLATWAGPSAPSPEPVTVEAVHRAAAAGMPFARKFSSIGSETALVAADRLSAGSDSLGTGGPSG